MEMVEDFFRRNRRWVGMRYVGFMADSLARKDASFCVFGMLVKSSSSSLSSVPFMVPFCCQLSIVDEDNMDRCDPREE